MQLQCPSCFTPTEASVGDGEQASVVCSSCGTSFQVIEDQDKTIAAEPRLLGKFQLLERVGVGAFGAVWKARDTELGRTVAVKTLHPNLVEAKTDRERFFREARAAAQLRHPGIVMVHEVAEIDGLPAIVSDFVEGVTLRELLEVRRLSIREAAEVTAQVADALDYAHSLKVVHRDIKPANIMIELDGASLSTSLDRTESGSNAASSSLTTPLSSQAGYSSLRSGPRARLLDFGLALRDDVEVTMTADGQVLGTPAYMSPEQAAGQSHKVDRRSDVYSLGVVLYELLVGATPFAGSKVAILQQVLHDEPRSTRKANHAIPRDLDTICQKAMAKAPGARYATARELSDDLRRWLSGLPIMARRVSETERFVRWCRRNPTVASLLGLLLLVFVAGFAGVWTQWRRAEAKADAELTQRLHAVDAERRARDNADAEAAARQRAEQAEQLAKNNADAEARARSLTEVALYHSDIARAQLEWRANNVSGAEQILDRCKPKQRGWEWHFLKQLNHSELLSLDGHTAWVMGVAYSPDGRFIASVGGGNPFWTTQGADSIRPGEVILWDAETGSRVRPFIGHSNVVRAVAFSTDGGRLATAGDDRVVKIWDIASGNAIHTLTGHEGSIKALAFSPDGQRLASGSDDKTIRLWDFENGELKQTLRGHTDWLRSVMYSGDGRTIASAATAEHFGVGEVKVWDVELGAETVKLEAIHGFHFGVAISRNGRQLAVASDQGVKLWDLATGQLQRILTGHRGESRYVAFSPDGQYVASAGMDSTVRVWKLSDGSEAMIFRGHMGLVTAVTFSPDGERLASCSVDGTVKVWDLTLHPEHAPVNVAGQRDFEAVEAIAFAADSKQVVAVSRGNLGAGGAATTFDAESQSRIGKVRVGVTSHWLTPGEPLSLDGAGQRLAGISSEDRRVAKLWDVRSGQELASFRGHDAPLWHAAISPDGRFVATAGFQRRGTELNGEVKVWDAETAKVLFEFSEPGLRVTRFAFRPETPGLAMAAVRYKAAVGAPTSQAESSVQLFEVPSGRKIKSLSGRDDFIAGLAFSPDGHRLAAVGTGSGTVLMYELTTGRESVYASGPDAAMDVAFNPDGTRLAVAGRLMVKLLDAATGEEALILRGVRQATFNSNGFNPRVRFSPDGKRIVAVCHDSHESVSLWSIDEQRTENYATGVVSAGDPNTRVTQPSPPAAGGDGRVSGPQERLAAARRRAINGHVNAEIDLRLSRDRPELEFHLARLDSQDLASPWEYLYRGAWHAALGDDERAEADLRRAFDLAPDDPHLWLERAAIFMDQGKWKQAALAQQRAMETQPAHDPAAWRDLALLQLESGNVDGYRIACAKLMERFGNTTDPKLAVLMVTTCTAAPDAGPDSKQLLAMLPAVPAQSEDGPSLMLRVARNAAIVRSNDFVEAARTLAENEKVDSATLYNAFNWLLIAMTEQRLGHAAEAQEWLQKARGRFAEIRLEHAPIVSNPTQWFAHQRLLFELLHREATSLIEPAKQPSDPTNKPVAPEDARRSEASPASVARPESAKGVGVAGGNSTPFADSGRATQPAEQSPPEIVFRDGLVIAPTGRFGRSAVHEDAVESLIVTGNWTTPKAGDTLTLPDDSSRRWEPITAGENATFQHRALGGGYLLCTVPSDEDRVMIVDAAGHSMVYVNGEPRTGDLYSNGWVRVPVMLRKGTNEFLFHVARGQLRAKLVPPKAAAQFDLADMTLPDLIVGESVDSEAGVVVINTTGDRADQLAIETTRPGGESRRTPLPALLPRSTRKVGVRFDAAAPRTEGECEVQLKLLARIQDEWTTLDTTTIKLRVVSPDATHKRTFRSAIDGSVQYFAVVPRKREEQKSDVKRQRPEERGETDERPALILTLHGAGVEAIGQANAYLQKDWAHVVAPTNRRPFGFDWEDWGRLDAMEVLDQAERQLHTAPGRTYLTGHSMGGHGVWQIGAHYPDRFAALGPSAGWVSMVSYAGARRPENPNATQEVLLRAASASDTLALARNYAQHGVYVLHGEKDDNVPVGQARIMKGVLEKFHADFAYHEEPGMGHWWGKDGIPGTACVDWPPMWEFFRKHTAKSNETVREIEFVTASPGVSAWSHWVGIEAQTRQFKPSSVRIQFDAASQQITGTTDNVARLVLDLAHLESGRTIGMRLDDRELPKLKLADGQTRIWLTRADGTWSSVPQPPASLKGPRRYGAFKDAFRNRVVFVYGTRGTAEENAWSLAKARFDAETFWYRGNGSIDVMSDWDFLTEMASVPLRPNDRLEIADRNVVLYGNADTNVAWQGLLKDSPIQVRRGRVEIGDRSELGGDFACLFIRPRPGSDTASVGVVSGTGSAGMRLTDRLPYFVSGVAYPDAIVLGPDMLSSGLSGVRVAGFFGLDWGVASGEFVWRE